MKCLVCTRRNEKELCNSCWNRGIDEIKQMPDLYTALEDELIPSKGYGEKVSMTKTPPLPMRLEVLYLRTGDITKVMYWHETQIRMDQNHSAITFRGRELDRIKGSADYMAVHWNWVRKHYTEGEKLLTEIHKIFGRIQAVMGNRSEEMSIGTCPALDEEGQTCGATLRINPHVLTTFGDIKCAVCATVWESTKWRLLGQILENSRGHGRSDLQSVEKNNSKMGA
jgi:hypothetical protein